MFNSSNVLQAVNHASIISIVNYKGEITYANDNFCKISQYAIDEILGENFKKLKSDQHSKQFFTDLWKTILKGKIWNGEIKNRAKDGTCYWTFTTITPVINEGEDILEFITIQFDISEKIRLTEKMNKLKIDLDQAMVEREIREQFLSTISHDLKTPLTIAKISAQMIGKNESQTEKIKSLAQKITSNIDRVDTMVTHLLDVNRNRWNQSVFLSFSEFDINEVVIEVLDNLKTIYGDRFKFTTEGNFKGTWCLSGIKRILENLLVNAVKYGESDTTINIKLQENEHHIILSVHNMGDPIPEVDQRIIFDYLQRTSSAERSEQKSWGLGLTIVKSIAELHGGSVRVFSFPGDGTTFTVTLPKN